MANVDIFAFLGAMNDGNYDYVDDMSDVEIKSLSPYVLTMWVNGVTRNAPEHILMTENLVNNKVFSLSNHPRLLYKLLIAANIDQDNPRYKFKKCGGKKSEKILTYICQHYGCGMGEARQYVNLLDEESVKELEEIYGD